jgi:glycosyltransferase involved in cell wall biosynthesis
MTAPRVLVVAYYFPPLGGGGVSRTLKLVRALDARGARVSVLTVDDAVWTRDPALLREVPPGVRVLRLLNPDWGRVKRARGSTTSATRSAGRLQRWLVPDLHVGWSALAAVATGALAAAGAVDVVYTTAPPYSGHLAGLAARALGVPFVADFRDAWADHHAREHLPRWRRRIERGLEALVLRRADRVVFASEAARTRAIARDPAIEARSETVLTGFDARELAGRGSAPGDRLTLVHAGSVTLDRKADTLERFLGALAAWARNEPQVADQVRVAFVGAEPEAAARIGATGLSDWVAIEPALPRSALGARLRGAHACLYLAPAGRFGGDPVPGKLFDAAGAGRPLVAIAPDGACTRLVRGRGLGCAFDPGDAQGLVAWLENARQRVAAGVPLDPPDAAGVATLSADRTIARLADLVADAASQRSGRRGEGPCRSASLS